MSSYTTPTPTTVLGLVPSEPRGTLGTDSGELCQSTGVRDDPTPSTRTRCPLSTLFTSPVKQSVHRLPSNEEQMRLDDRGRQFILHGRKGLNSTPEPSFGYRPELLSEKRGVYSVSTSKGPDTTGGGNRTYPTCWAHRPTSCLSLIESKRSQRNGQTVQRFSLRVQEGPRDPSSYYIFSGPMEFRFRR